MLRKCSYVKCKKMEESRVEFMVCSRCKLPCYCSRRCQKLDWKHEHKQKCGKCYEFNFIDRA